MLEFLRLLFAPCSEISQHTSRELDAELTRSERIAICLHGMYCAACRRYRRQIRELRRILQQEDAIRRLADPSTCPTCLSADARERLKKALSQD